MNICIITSSFPSNLKDIPQAPFLIDFLGELRKRRHQVCIFTQDRMEAGEEFLEGIKIRWFPWMKSNRPLIQFNPINPLDGFRIGNLFYNGRKALLPFIRENKIDACLALWILPSGYLANYAYRHLRVPYSVWALGSDIYRYGSNPFLYRMMKRIIHEAKGVFADGFDLAKRVEDRFKKRCSFLPTTRTIPPAPPLIKSVRLETEGDGGGPDRAYQFLFVGRLEKVKGIDLLLHAIALLKEENVDFHLTVAGVGGMEKWARDFMKEKKLEGYVDLAGNVPDEALAILYSISACVVIPSRSESIPLVFSEALKFNKELIVTDIGDMGMLGRRYGVAWVVPPENPLALKEMMKKRVESQDMKRDEGDEAKREELKHLFNIETSVERFLEDY